jgi:multiple sugar transport system substrate-binding protein
MEGILDNSDISINGFTRREALTKAMAFGLVAGAPLPVKAAGEPNLSSYAAARAKALATGRSVKLRVLIPNGSQDNIEPVVAAFEQQTGIEVQVETVALEDINTHLILGAFATDQPYDVALPATFGLPDLVEAGAIRSLTDFAKIHEPDGHRSGILFDVGDSFDDNLYGFQTDGDTYVMFYNSKMLNDPSEQELYLSQTGKPLEIPDTWQELDRQMAFFHRPEQGRYGGALFRIPGYLAWEFWVRFHAKGLWPFSPDMEPQIASEQGVDALTELINASGSLVPEAGTLGLFDNWRRFERGDVYCNIGWGGTQKYLNGPNSAIRGDLSFGPTPGGMIGDKILKTPYFNWGWSYVVGQASPEPEIAYLLSLFASSPEISTISIRAQGGYFDPIRAEHYQDKVIREVYSDAFLDVQRESLLGSIPDLYLANQGEYFSVLNRWLDAALNDAVNPRVALERTAQEWALITIRAGVDNQRKRWSRLRAKYPVSAQELLQDL